MTASVLAGELGLPLFVVRMDGLMTRFTGETSAKLRIVFDAIQGAHGVYLFDEFDSIGAKRGFTNDVDEVRRVLNSFLQLIELDDSDSLLIAATNHPQLLDHALLRRFDDIIEYHLPDRSSIAATIKAKLAGFPSKVFDYAKAERLVEGSSHGDITRTCEDAIKQVIIPDRSALSEADLAKALADRKRAHETNQQFRVWGE